MVNPASEKSKFGRRALTKKYEWRKGPSNCLVDKYLSLEIFENRTWLRNIIFEKFYKLEVSKTWIALGVC